ncbi:MAG: BTAD domain-containing putative transcriptional regulator [Halanaerobiales bacterium]
MLNVLFLTHEPIIKRNEKLITFDTRKCMGIFTYLAINKGQLISREKLASLYWADFSEERSRKNLNDTLWRIKKTFQEQEISTLISVISDRTHISLMMSDEVYIDIDIFKDLIYQAQNEKDLQKKINLLKKAVKMHKGTLLYGFDVPWLEEIRVDYHNKLKEARISLINSYKTTGEYLDAITITKNALNDNPYDDSFAYELILLYYLSGDISQAINEFRKYSNKLNAELGIHPGPKIKNLLSAISNNSFVWNEDKYTLNNEFWAQYPEKVEELKTEEYNIEKQIPLIGRGEEINIFKKTFYNIIKNNVSSVLIFEGEAGIGKSHLLDYFIRFSNWHNLITISTECNNIDEPPSYLLIGKIIKQIINHSSSLKLNEELSPHILNILSTLVPDIKETIENSADNYNHIFYKQFEKNHLYQAVEQLFVTLTQKSPITLLIDDIHWADRESLEILLYLFEHMDYNHGLFIVMTKRPDLKDTEQIDMLTMYRNINLKFISLQPLSFDAVSQILDYLIFFEDFTFDGHKEILIQKLMLETGGNPLFLKETIRYWIEKNILTLNTKSKSWNFDPPLNYPNDISGELPEDFNIPENIFNVFKTRISILDEKQKQFVEYAAVAGYKFDVDILKYILDKSDEDLINMIDLLIRKGIFSETEQGNIIRFAHRKQREFIYISMSNLKKNILHKKIYQFLSSNQYYNQRVEDLAWHSYKAGLWNDAVRYNMMSGDLFLKSSNLFITEHYFDRAYKITINKEIDPEITISILEKRITIAILTGDTEKAHNLLTTLNKFAQEFNNKRAQSMTPALLAQIKTWKGEFKAAVRHLDIAIKLSKRNKEYDIMLKSLHMLSLVGQMSVNENLISKVSLELDHIINKVNSHNNNNNNNNNNEALHVLSTALFIKGQHLFLYGKIEEAVIHLKQAEEKNKTLDEKYKLAIITAHPGLCYIYQNKNDIGMEYLVHSYNEASKHNNIQAQCFSLTFFIII